jgi:hypothetical protein
MICGLLVGFRDRIEEKEESLLEAIIYHSGA